MTQSVLITGTSTGLGLALSVLAAQSGFTVFATMRDLTKRGPLDTALAAAGVTAEVLQLDVTDQTSIDAAVAAVIARHGSIDQLVNNAGAGFLRPVDLATEAEIDGVLDVNLRGVIRCTRAVLPAMRAARSGRVITISSVGGLVGQPFNELYCAAKFGVEGFIEALSTYTGPAFGLHFTLVEPGGIASEFSDSAMKQFAAGGGIADTDYQPLLNAYVAGVRARAGEGGVNQTAQQVAQIVLDCMTMDAPPVRLRTSDWAETLTRFKTVADPDGTHQQQDLISRNFGRLPLVS